MTIASSGGLNEALAVSFVDSTLTCTKVNLSEGKENQAALNRLQEQKFIHMTNKNKPFFNYIL